jgi:hypothetical protein
MTPLSLGDVFPAVSAFGGDDVHRLVGTIEPTASVEELPAELLLAEWLSDGRLMPPITARLAIAVLEHTELSATSLLHLTPDLVRATARIRETAGLSEASVSRIGPDAATRWNVFDMSPGESEARWGRSVAMELTAAAIREAARQAFALKPAASAEATDVATALAVISDWAVGELGLQHLGDALDAARADVHAPQQVRRALAVLEGIDLTALATPAAGVYDVRAALRRLLDVDQRSRIVLERRVYAGPKKQTLDELGRALNVTRERIRQIEVQLLKGIAERLQDEQFDVVHRTAARLRADIGECRRLSDVPDRAAWALDLREAPSSEHAVHARFLFEHAGPWRVHDGWLLHRDSADLPTQTQDALDERLADGPIPEEEAFAILTSYGVPTSDTADWLRVVCSCRVIDGQVIQWRGSMADKAAAILALRGEPLTPDEFIDVMGPDTNQRSMVGQIQGDRRFLRRGLKLYGLRQWGGEEYTTIKEEIEQEIERQGGAASLDHLIRTLCSQFGVAETSVRAYAADAPFVRTADGRIAVGASEVRYERRAIEDCRGCFRVGNQWAWRVVVDGEILRGSGRPLPTGVLQSIGMRPGDVRHMNTPAGDVMLRYSRQATIGSLRRAAIQLDCTEGDRLFVVLRSDDELDFSAVRSDDVATASGLDRVAKEVGAAAGDDPTVATARALGLPPDEYQLSAIRRRLRARKEHELLELVPDADDAAADDGLLDELIGLGE